MVRLDVELASSLVSSHSNTMSAVAFSSCLNELRLVVTMFDYLLNQDVFGQGSESDIYVYKSS